MTVRFRKDRGWWEYDLQLTDTNGQKRRIRVGKFARKKDATTAEDEAKKQHAGGIAIDGAKVTFAEYMDKWLEIRKARLEPSTYQRYGELNRLHLVPLLGKTQLRKLQPLQLQDAYSAMTAKGLSERTAEQAHAVAHSALKQAVKWRLIASNPSDFVDKPSPEAPVLHMPDLDETRKLLEAADANTKYGRIFWLCALTGCRIGEVLALRWRFVDFSGSTIEVRAKARREKGKGIVISEHTKTKRIRTVALPSPALGLLAEQRQLQKRDREQLGEDYEDADLVFANPLGGAYDATWLDAVWKRDVAKPLGLGDVRPHDLRHAFVSRLLAKGFNPKLVQEMVGHKTAAFMLDQYAHVMPSMQAEAAEAIGKMLTPGNENGTSVEPEEPRR